MNIRYIKLLDEIFGPIFCLVFYCYNLIRKIIFGNRYSLDPQKIKNILVLKFFGMGSIILAGPMLRALRLKFPAAKITILTFLNNKDICQRIGSIDAVVTVDPSSPLKFIKSLLRAILYIRSKHCEISIDMEFFAKSSTLIQYLCGTKVRVGYYLIQRGVLLKIMWRGNLITHNVYYNPHRHTSEVFLALAKSIGATTDDMRPAILRIDTQDRAHLKNLLFDIGINDGDYLVTFNINASQLSLERRWPIEKFVELTKRILNHSSIKIILIGDIQDITYVDLFFKMMKDAPRLFNFSGKLNTGMLLVLLENSKLLITNDSGPLHIAVSLGTPTVSFFGPEIPERYGPIGQKHTVFYSGVYCSPCLNVYNQKSSPCNGENECMRKIPVEDVCSVIERYLK